MEINRPDTHPSPNSKLVNTYELMMRYVLADSDILDTKPVGEHTLVLWIQMLRSYKKNA
jgi:hypothetical protein